MHGWCPERENGGKGGPGHGKIGAKVVGDGFLPIRRFSWDAVAHQFCIFWYHFWPVGIRSGSSRDPVGIQSGTNFGIFRTAFGPVGKQLKSHQNVPKPCKNAVFCDFGWFRTAVPTAPDWVPTGSLDPDWIPTGSRLDPDRIPTGQKWRQKIEKWCATPGSLSSKKLFLGLCKQRMSTFSEI